MPYARDPLSVYYDGYVRQVIIRAMRASRSGRGVRVWVASPRGDFARLDRGGRTSHERAFTRSAYYLVKLHRDAWSLKLTWGPDTELRASSGRRLARPVMVRLFPRDQARVSGPRWTDNPDLQSGGIGSGKERF